MLNLMKKYGGVNNLKNILTRFYESVCDQREIKHYFFNVKLENLIDDQLHYSQYIMSKTDRGYKEPPMQSTPTEIRVSPSVFDDVMVTLSNLLLKVHVHRDDVPRLVSMIIDLAEETRAQANDTKIMILKSVDINVDTLVDYYNKSKVDARVEKSGEIYTTRGVVYPYWTRLDTNAKTISFIGRAFTNDPTRVNEMKEVMARAQQKIPFLLLEPEVTPTLAYIFCKYELQYSTGIPTRLLMRCGRDFSTAFNEVLLADKGDILKNVTR